MCHILIYEAEFLKAPIQIERYSKDLTNKYRWKKYNKNYKRKYVKDNFNQTLSFFLWEKFTET